MSLHDYRQSRELSGASGASGATFYALLMAAMRRADTDNTEKLKEAFPETYEELRQRYRAPGGVLDTDPKPAIPQPRDSR